MAKLNSWWTPYRFLHEHVERNANGQVVLTFDIKLKWWGRLYFALWIAAKFLLDPDFKFERGEIPLTNSTEGEGGSNP